MKTFLNKSNVIFFGIGYIQPVCSGVYRVSCARGKLKYCAPSPNQNEKSEIVIMHLVQFTPHLKQAAVQLLLN